MFGPPSPEEATRRVVSGEAWDQFCDLLKAAGHNILDARNPSDPQTRTEGFRYLTRLTRAGLEAFVEHNDPAAPQLARVVHETVKMGSDNPDNFYQNAAVSGAYAYRITGHRGSVHWLELATQRGSYGQSRGMPPTGRLDGRDLVCDADGRFTIEMCATRPPDAANWLPLKPESGTLIIRQSRLDPATEQLATFSITRIGGAPGPTALTAPHLEEGLRTAGMLVGGAAAIFKEWALGFQAHVNELPVFDQALSDSMGGVPGITYHHSAWRLPADAALVIETPVPPCDHWNFQLNNHWMESLDYRHHRIHINSKTAVYEPDGSVRIVVAHDDPGHPNWIRTVGHTHGTMCFRWVWGEGELPVPACRVVALDALRRELHPA
jgi:hypothetical protein